ncbi:RTA1 like protein-domain-containing protein [Plectosphaerella plurivora]|uniref:RTA1 like protein-domain-containing protein n=1 Tax=Plectosphaerella plurivora TaxID=936078 RepID=A0A9P8V1Z0_9PEZI|nr:RTA1 like protein-domain-containing protein [Plectosphaerella plurivora]
MSTDEAFEPSYDTCKAISDICPVEATLYGHFFSKPASAFFAVGFAACLLGQIWFTYKSRAWFFAIWVGIGTLMELIGYACRVMMADNPWKFMPFVLQLFTLMLAPTFIAAGISVTFKHLVLRYGPEYSLIRPKWLPWLFVGSDIFSILIQAVGCAFAAMATSGTEGGSSKPSDPKLENRIVIFVWASSTGFVAIIVRCIYRIPEMAAGWGSSIMQHELSFLIFDAAMVLLAASLLTIFHPAKFFPLLSAKSRREAGIPMTVIPAH